jgi:hypothetical protein
MADISGPAGEMRGESRRERWNPAEHGQNETGRLDSNGAGDPACRGSR